LEEFVQFLRDRPAGLGCAAECRRNVAELTVFEKEMRDLKTEIAGPLPAGRKPIVAFLVGLLALGLLGLSAGKATAAVPEIRVLGASEFPPKPACPETEQASCMAVGKVTVFQTQAGLAKAPYVVPFRGKIVSWSITLSRPKAAEIRGFNDFYGKPAQARIAVLRRVGTSKPPVYKMVRQSPVQELTRYFGRTVHFALERPLTVLEGQVVALTIPTWAPNWAINLPEDNAWRASRSKKRCNDSDIQDYSRPQQKVGSTRQYGCYFTNTRFLYTATVVKEPAGRAASASVKHKGAKAKGKLSAKLSWGS
jgi:hypothetical protein